MPKTVNERIKEFFYISNVISAANADVADANEDKRSVLQLSLPF